MRFIFLFLAVSRLMAIIPTQVFYEISDYFIHSYYSPTVGKAALTSGLIYNLRFFGNYEAFYNEEKEWVPRLDKGLDPIQKLLIHFFPSLPYELSVETTAYSNFAKKVSIPKIAGLLNYCFEIRKNPDQYFNPSLPTCSKRDIEIAQKKLFKQFQDLGHLRDTLIQCILFEYNIDDTLDKKTTKVIYPAFTTEQIILSLFVQKFESRYDIIALMSCLSPEIVRQPFDATVDDRWSIATVNLVKERIETTSDKVSLDALYYFSYHSPHAPMPYKSGMSVLSNGNCPPFNRKLGVFSKQLFADCHETTLRHWFNILFFDKKEHRFILPALQIETPLYHQLNLFYRKQSIYDVNDGSEKMRGEWNMIVGDLNAIEPYDVPIHYAKPNNNELRCGYSNFIFVCKKILMDNLDLDPKPPVHASNLIKSQWVVQSLKKIIAVLNPTLTVKSITFEQFKVHLNDLMHEDYFGRAQISLINKDNIPFSFVLSHVPKHAFLDKIEYEDCAVNLPKQNLPELKNTLSLLKYSKENPDILLYEMLGVGKIDDNAKKIAFIDKFKSVPEVYYPIFYKVLFHFNYDDPYFSINLSATLFNHSAYKTFFPYIRQLYILSSFDELDLSNARALERLEVSNKIEIKKLTLEPYGSLKELHFNGSVHTLNLSEQPQLQHLEVGFISKITEINFPIFKGLKHLDLQAFPGVFLDLTSADYIETITLGANTNICKLILPLCRHLRKMVLTGKIKDADLHLHLQNASNLDTLQLSEDVDINDLDLPASAYLTDISLCGKIRSANLEKAVNLKNIKIESIARIETLIYPPLPTVTSLFIQGFIDFLDITAVKNVTTLNLTADAFIKQLRISSSASLKKVNNYGQLYEVVLHTPEQAKLFTDTVKKITHF